MGENDRLLTILTREFGLLRAIAPGSRKHASTLRGRSGLFVINQLLLVPGKSLDKIIQAETQASFPKLSQDLGKLTAAQYLAELCLYQALSEQPQEELFEALRQRLMSLEQVAGERAIAILVEGIVQMLHLAGVIPEVERCSVTRQPIPQERSQSRWQVGFHPAAGGVVSLAVFDRLCSQERQSNVPLANQETEMGAVSSNFPFTARPALGQNKETDTALPSQWHQQAQAQWADREDAASVPSIVAPDATTPTDAASPIGAQRLTVTQSSSHYRARRPVAGTRLTQDEWHVLQHVVALQRDAAPLPALSAACDSPAIWLALERALRYYTQYHFERAIQSAHLIDACFAALPSTVSPNS